MHYGGCAVLFKQWGEWWPIHGTGIPAQDDLSPDPDSKPARPYVWVSPGGKTFESSCEPDALMLRVGKGEAGCVIDESEWKEFP
jgi:hypothetical protein